MDDKATAKTLDDLAGELFQGDDALVAPDARKPADVAETFDGVDPSAETLMERCAFARHFKDDAATLHYDDWYAGVGLFARTDGGPVLVHELSKPYSSGTGYNFDQTQAKIDEVLRAAGPPSCSSIASATGGRFCDGCPARLAAEKDGRPFANPLVLARRRMVKDGAAKKPETPADLVAEAEGVLAGMASLDKETVYGAEIIAALTTLHHHDRAKYELLLSQVPTGTKTGVNAAVRQLAKKHPPVVRRDRVDPLLQDDPKGLPVVVLPGGSIRVMQSSAELGKLLAKTNRVFLRGGVVMVVGRDRDDIPVLLAVKAASLPAEFESIARLARLQVTPNGTEKVPAICSESIARLILHSNPFLDRLPPIEIMSRCPVLIERDGKLVEVSGYDRESRILATGGPVPEVPLDEAVRLISELVRDFHFRSPADRSRAIAAIITPALVHGGVLGGRAPVDLGEADQSQGGKGYRNKTTAAVYNDRVKAVTQRTGGGVGSLDERFDDAMIKGHLFTSLDNIVGKFHSPSIESYCTEDSYSARAPHTRNIDIDPRRTVLMMTSNRAVISKDFSNRSSCVLIVKQEPGYEFKSYDEGDILAHVRANQPRFLGAVFAIIRAWHEGGKPQTSESRHDFRKWARTLDWIIQKIFRTTPLMDGHESTQKCMVNPAKNWLRDVTLAIERAGQCDEWLRTKHLFDVICAEPDIKIPGLKEGDDPEDETVHTKVLQSMGRELSRCFTASDTTEIDGFEIMRRQKLNSEGRLRPEYRFSSRTPYPRKETVYENTVFPENPLTPKGTWENAWEEKKEVCVLDTVVSSGESKKREEPFGIGGGKTGSLGKPSDGNGKGPEKDDVLWI